MKHLRQAVLAIACVITSLAASSPALAAGTLSGKVGIINIYGVSTQPFAVLSFSTGAQTPASCSQWPAAMTIDASTTRGKAQLNLITAAFLAGKSVSVTGSGSCATPAGFGLTVETISYVSVQ